MAGHNGPGERDAFGPYVVSEPLGAGGSADGVQFLVPRLDLQDAPITVVLNWWVELEGP